jgi:hypothetical protein
MTQSQPGGSAPCVLGPYTELPIGMDHPIFVAKMQATIDAQVALRHGTPISAAIISIAARMRELFGEVPTAMVAAQVSIVYASAVAEGAQP